MALATSSTSLLGLATSSLESSLTTILMESVLKLSSLTDANVFVMVESTSEGRCWAGRKQLRDSFLSGCLQPESSDIEFDVDPHITCLVKKATPLPSHSVSPQGVHQKKQKHMRQMLAGPTDLPSGGPGPPSPPPPRVDRDPTLRHHSGQHASSSSNDHSSSRKRANSDRDSARTVHQQQLPQLSNSLALPTAAPNLRFSPQYPVKQSNLLLSPVTTLTVPSSKQSNLLRSSTSELIEDISPPLSSKPPDHPPLLQQPPPAPPPQHQVPLQQLNVTNVSNDAHLSSPPINTNRLSPRFSTTHSKRTELLLTGSIDAASLLKEESSHQYEREPENDDRDIKHAVSFFDRAQRAFQQELANVAAASGTTADSQSNAVLDMLSRQEHATSLENRMRSDSAASGDASQSRYMTAIESAVGPPVGGKTGPTGVGTAHGSDRVNRFLDATIRFPPLGIDIPTPAGHEGGGGAGGGGSPVGSDNGMGDYEDDIPAGGSAFGSGGTTAPGVSQGNTNNQRGGDYPSQSDPQPGSSRETGRPPGGGGGGPFEAEAAINLETLVGLKGLDPNSETIVRYPSQRGKTKLCYKGWRYVFDRPVSKPFPLHLFLCMYKRDKKCKGAVWIDPVTEAVHKTVDHDYDTTPQYEAARREVEDRLQFSLYYSNMQTHNPTNPMAGTPGLNYPPI